MTSPCQGPHCRADIDWATKPDGTGRLPITHPAKCRGSGASCTHDGSLAIHRQGSRLIYRAIPPGGLLEAGEHRAMPHHAECPDADLFRRPKRPRRRRADAES